MAAVSVAAVAIPAARAAEPDLVSTLQDKARRSCRSVRAAACGLSRDPGGRRRLQPLCDRRWPCVAGLLYGPDGVLITGGQLGRRAWRKPSGGNRTEPAPDTRAERCCTRCAGEPGGRAARVRRYRDRAAGRCFHDECTWRWGPGSRRPARSCNTRYGQPRLPAVLFERSASAFGFTLGERGPLVVLFGDPELSMVALGRGAGPAARRWPASCGCMSCRWRCWARLRRTARRGSLQVPIRRKPGSPATMVRPGQDARDRIARNNALFDAWGERSVPLIAYRTMQGGIRAPRRRHRRSRRLAAGTRR